MNEKVASLAIKAGKAVMRLIATQIVNYLSSEEFSNKVKVVIKNMVEQLVKLVISEKETAINK